VGIRPVIGLYHIASKSNLFERLLLLAPPEEEFHQSPLWDDFCFLLHVIPAFSG
jgi:hypothetical protein